MFTGESIYVHIDHIEKNCELEKCQGLLARPMGDVDLSVDPWKPKSMRNQESDAGGFFDVSTGQYYYGYPGWPL